MWEPGSSKVKVAADSLSGESPLSSSYTADSS